MELLIAIAQILQFKESVIIAYGKRIVVLILQGYVQETYVASRNSFQIVNNLLAIALLVAQQIPADIV